MAVHHRAVRLGLRIGILLISVIGMVSACGSPTAPNPINIGLIAPMTGQLAVSGQAIQRGILLAADEMNRSGGVLGRPIQLVVRDVANDPVAGEVALHELAAQSQIVAVFGGIYSPVMLGQLEAIHELQIPLINPWGSVPGITKNDYSPNYAFRVSVSDTYADEFLVRYAQTVLQAQQIALLADSSAWGESNVRGISDWATRLNLSITTIQRFDQGQTDMLTQVQAAQSSGADSIILIANAPEGAAIVRAMHVQNWQVPVISHWGISGGNFIKDAGVENTKNVYTLQTYSFFGQQTQRGKALFEAYRSHFSIESPREIGAPVGVAHGYDGMHLLGMAINLAGSTEGPAIRDALERLPAYDGLIKYYNPAFSPEQHDALYASDYIMAIWQDGVLVPAPQPRLPTP